MESGELSCDFVAGCDGFHGVCRTDAAVARAGVRARYPSAGSDHAQRAPSESGIRTHPGVRAVSMRSQQVTGCTAVWPAEDANDWSDDRIWSELRTRLRTSDGWEPNEGAIFQKGVTGMRSFVVEPLRFGRMFLAGDAAHIVPPNGAKGLNLAMADVSRLADALAAFYTAGSEHLLDEYSDRALKRTWRAQRFSWWMTTMLHRVPGEARSTTAADRGAGVSGELPSGDDQPRGKTT